MTREIRVSAAVLVDEHGCALLVRKRGTRVFQQPGGKPEPGESARDALVREVLEEVGVRLEPDALEPLGIFRAAAANEPGHTVVADAFRARVRRVDVRIGAEIEEARWLGADTAATAPLAPLSRDHLLRHAWTPSVQGDDG